ncbi:MAG: hypothetical protein KKH74_01745 [Gammaproteobacteria bacterium]|nr:hypothetical protein [Gammaproteobacteria bacterium]MBU1731034.1 hypothetical protein [Gammaproteobacteria bacterium]MBU1893694.1 hypothetical protein [Gammaproteobacteria bacterium]
MLNIRQSEKTITVTHHESGAKFTLRPLTPRKYQELQKKSHDKKGGIDAITMAGNAAKYIIVDWEGVGDENGEIECSDENRYTFGENLAFHVVPFLIDESMNFDRYLNDETTAAKNA